MYRIELNGTELKKFLNYLGERYHSQPSNESPGDLQTTKDIKHFIVSYNRQSKNKYNIYPSYDTFYWHYNDDIFKIQFFEEGKVLSSPDGLEYFMRLYIFHEDLKKIEDLLKDAFNFIAKVDEKDKVQFYVSKCNPYCASWDSFNIVNVQTIDNIFIDKKLKCNIVEYIDNFIASKEKYNKFGRTHKTNLLLTGVPGSGKTSLCKALAKKYGYSIYIMNFTKNMTDAYLIELTSDVKDNSIILYEDIDSYFSERTANDVNISFSCLINILDGTLSKGSGIINIITTNFPNKLDSAMLRPGRIDKIINFDYPKKEEIKDAFISLIGSDNNFKQFYGLIKNCKVNMATIIDYLFRYPDNYLENIDELVTQYNFIQQFTKEESSSKLYS